MEERRTMRYLVFSVCAGMLVLLSAFAGAASAATWTVNDGGGGADFASIQAGVDAASDGDSIEVWGGTYTENVDVNKAHLTLRGEGRDVVTVTAASADDHVFDVTEDYVNISGFKVTGAPAEMLCARRGVAVETRAGINSKD
ncbi:MAG: hypothetical protein CHKLHMKO_00432 [Candidatus Argoarchaeum ethanivorans]|uniref:DUF1565 domain-containing protein n=1 Tax=Candidatus Argoarchaeum ethanivorans TaxID=2608793 RepID=A0A811TFE5_9EURY|nr:MAG: hypothetical protein CHKLHMKO_00432 [Candidatus Argoarchaeum ethanivorans]